MKTSAYSVFVAVAFFINGCASNNKIRPQTLISFESNDSMPTSLLEQENFIDSLFAQLAIDTCGIRPLIATRSSIFDPNIESKIGEIATLAYTLCDLDFYQASSRINARGENYITGSENGWLVGKDVLVVFDGHTDSVPPIQLSEQTRANTPRQIQVINFSSDPLLISATESFLCNSANEIRCIPDSDVLSIPPESTSSLYTDTQEEELELFILDEDPSNNLFIWNGASLTMPIQVENTQIDADVLSTGQYCSGYIDETPTITLRIRNMMNIDAELIVEADTQDPVLVLIAPNGNVYCNDDYYGYNPAIIISLTAGDWLIYAGSFSYDENFSATFRLEPM